MAKFSVDTDMIEKLATIVSDKELAEIEIANGEDSIRITRTWEGEIIAAPQMAAPVAAAPAPQGFSGAAAPAAATPAASAPATESAPSPSNLEDHPGAVKSPMVGTVYLAPQPGAANFIKEGDSVSEGDTLLIVEAMKVMNQIPAPTSGTVKQIVISDGSPIEYGEVLVIIE